MRDPEKSADLSVQRDKLDKAYSTCRRDAAVVEARLGAYFETDEARKAWHKIDDLLSIRYFFLAGQLTERLRKMNAKGYEGKEHTGMSATDLDRPGLAVMSRDVVP
jgi:hypothetical protein